MHNIFVVIYWPSLMHAELRHIFFACSQILTLRIPRAKLRRSNLANNIIHASSIPRYPLTGAISMLSRSSLALQRSGESPRPRKDEEINNTHRLLVNLIFRS